MGEGAAQTFSRNEQAGLGDDDEEIAAQIAAGNEAYEERFGRVFIIRAGPHAPRDPRRTDAAPRAAQRHRVEIVGEQLREIALLRLDKSFGGRTVVATSPPTFSSTLALGRPVGAASGGRALTVEQTETLRGRGSPHRNDDGRVEPLTTRPDAARRWEYRIVFETGVYFAASEHPDGFYPRVTIDFELDRRRPRTITCPSCSAPSPTRRTAAAEMTAPRTRAQRLDELPFTGSTAACSSAGLGWALDAMDVGLHLVRHRRSSRVRVEQRKGELAFVASAGFVGHGDRRRASAGSLADRLGRTPGLRADAARLRRSRRALSALGWSVGALLVLRFVVGLGLGAELPVASTLVSEFSPARIRGRVVVHARGVLGPRLDRRRAGRLPRDPRERRRLALGAPARRAAGRLRRVRAAADARVGAVPRVEGPARRGRARRCARSRRRRARRRSPRPADRRGAAAAAAAADAATAPTRLAPPRGACSGRPAPPHRRALGRLVLRQLLVLRGLHLAADAARRRGLLAREVVRVHAAHHARAAARLRRRRPG